MSTISDDPQAEAIKRIAEGLLAGAGVELVEANIHRHAGGLQILFLVDKVGGMTIQDCARLNKQIIQAVDPDGTFDTAYTLEVSSPGLDRPLVTTRDYQRALGEELDIELLEPIAGTKGLQFKAKVLAVHENAVVLAGGTGNVTVPFSQIQRARKAIRW